MRNLELKDFRQVDRVPIRTVISRVPFQARENCAYCAAAQNLSEIKYKINGFYYPTIMKTDQASNDTYHGYAAYEPGLAVKPWTYPAKPFEDDDIEFKITHCGICGSDIHTITGEWGKFENPIVVGHEIVGTVCRIGSKVDTNRFKLGQRVGVGAQCGTSCQPSSCHECSAKNDHVCLKHIFTYNSKYPNGYVSQGGYADYYRCSSRFVVPIPNGLSNEIAAP